MEQVTVLAETFNEPVTVERLRIYAHDLADLDRESLQLAFTRARRQLKFFPKIAELRGLAGADDRLGAADVEEVEAQAAFQAVIRSLERSGIDAGIKHLPERVQYAVRQCGGLWQFNKRLQTRYGGDDDPSFADDRSFVFLQKHFVTAYRSWTVHNAILPKLTEKGLVALPPAVRAFLRPSQIEVPKSEATTPKPAAPAPKPKKIPEPPTDAQVRDRREILRQQAEFLNAKAAAQHSLGRDKVGNGANDEFFGSGALQKRIENGMPGGKTRVCARL